MASPLQELAAKASAPWPSIDRYRRAGGLLDNTFSLIGSIIMWLKSQASIAASKIMSSSGSWSLLIDTSTRSLIDTEYFQIFISKPFPISACEMWFATDPWPASLDSLH